MKPYFVTFFQLLIKRKGTNMEDQYPNQLEDTNLYDEPSDDELQRIEDELLDF